MDVKYKRADALDCRDVIIKNGEEVLIDSVHNVCGYVRINNDEVLTPPEAHVLICNSRLSDLEIVQKALDKTGLELRVGKDWILVCGEDYSGDDALEVYYEGWGPLLTWAKQTIGVE